MEALKAQAVAARSEALAKFGKRHQGQPFDLCADVHCQVYSGLSEQSARTNRAVKETRGKVLWKDGQICDAVYSASCGGHTEHNDKAWGGNPVSYLRGTYDGTNRIRRFGSLSREKNVEQWINDYPREAHCNTTYGRVPNSLNYTKKYFRWEVAYTQDELRSVLERSQNRTVGPVRDLIPMNRGVSGRVTRLKVAGLNGNYIIEGELRIRKALSESTLWSSCIYIQKYGYGTIPNEFVIRGAGFGHGVGMCQTGAAMMALKGKKYERILRYYFQGVKIQRIY
jgi:SpoIID/LytB domain protein